MPLQKPQAELVLLLATLALIVFAAFGPPMAQAEHYHAFADQRSWLGIPCAMDVLSNLPFALFGAAGLWVLARMPAQALGGTQRAQHQLAAVFFGGLILTAFGSAWYHWQPDDAGLAVDRLGMTVAFAGLLGLGAAAHISARAGWVLAVAVLLAGVASVALWATQGNMLPWVVLQVGGLVWLLVLGWVSPLPGAVPVRWWLIVVIYTVAKGLELADATVFEGSAQWVSGHSLKHVVASFAAWPVIAGLGALMQNAGKHARQPQRA